MDELSCWKDSVIKLLHPRHRSGGPFSSLGYGVYSDARDIEDQDEDETEEEQRHTVFKLGRNTSKLKHEDVEAEQGRFSFGS